LRYWIIRRDIRFVNRRNRPEADSGYFEHFRLYGHFFLIRLRLPAQPKNINSTAMPNYFLQLLKYICLILLITIPCVAITGIMAPWPVAERALGPGWAHESVLIGMSSESRSSGDQSHHRRTQIYLGLPSSPHAFRTISVTEENGAVRTEEDPLGLLSMVAIYATLAVGNWWFWIRPRKKRPGAHQ